MHLFLLLNCFVANLVILFYNWVVYRKNLWDTCRFMHVHVLSLNFFKLGSIWAVVCCWNHSGYQRWHKVRLHKIYTLKYPIYSKLGKYKSCWNGSKIEYLGWSQNAFDIFEKYLNVLMEYNWRYIHLNI